MIATAHHPACSHITTIGAMAKIGTVWDAITYGINPRSSSALLMASDSLVRAGISAIVRRLLIRGFPPTNRQRNASRLPVSSWTARAARAFWIEAAIFNPGVRGIYHVGDDQPVTIQWFLDEACRIWGYPPPRRVPFWLIYTAAVMCELAALVVRSKSPLTRDFVRLGRVPHWGDTTRARTELIPELRYPTLVQGLESLKARGSDTL